jgi:hypothetical protein
MTRARPTGYGREWWLRCYAVMKSTGMVVDMAH